MKCGWSLRQNPKNGLHICAFQKLSLLLSFWSLIYDRSKVHVHWQDRSGVWRGICTKAKQMTEIRGLHTTGKKSFSLYPAHIQILPIPKSAPQLIQVGPEPQGCWDRRLTRPHRWHEASWKSETVSIRLWLWTKNMLFFCIVQKYNTEFVLYRVVQSKCRVNVRSLLWVQ